MIVNEFVTGLVAILIGYGLGSIPSACLLTRWKNGKDIRRLGGGNVGGLNTFREVGLWPAVAVGIVDLSKGAAAVAITHWALSLDPVYVFIAAGAGIVGHNWMVWLRFSGGKGMGAAIGSLFVLMPVYGYALGLVIVLGLILVPLVLVRNVALAMGIGLVSLPFVVWLTGGLHTGMFVIWSVAVGLMIAVKFSSTALASLKNSSGIKDFIRGD